MSDRYKLKGKISNVYIFLFPVKMLMVECSEIWHDLLSTNPSVRYGSPYRPIQATNLHGTAFRLLA